MEYKDLKELYDNCTYCQAKMHSKKQYIEGDLVLNLPQNPKGLYNLLAGAIRNNLAKKNAPTKADEKSKERSDSF